MINGVIENMRGNNILKRSCGSIVKNFSNRVGIIEILNAALSNNEGFRIQIDWVKVVWKRLYSLFESYPRI
jgi:hypothetical protein